MIMAKREISVVVEKLSCYELEGSALSVIKMLQAHVDEYGHTAYLEYEDEGIVVTYRRMETDDEYNKRIQRNRSRKELIEQNERKTLEQLKKKYET